MHSSFRQSMAWLHTWTGLVVGWVLFLVFVTGTAGYVQYEISRWMRPELPMEARGDLPSPDVLVGHALARLEANAPEAKSWQIILPHAARQPRGWQPLSIRWEEMPPDRQDFGRTGSEVLDAVTGQALVSPEPRDTWGGAGLYRMHYALHYVPYWVGYYIVGICTMLMLVAVFSGVITHKKIIADFFTFRPGKGQRSWLDAHNVISVMSLPFFTMITYSGLVFFTTWYAPAPVAAVYGTGDAAMNRYWDDRSTVHKAGYQPARAEAALLARLVTEAEAEWGAGRVAQLRIEHPRGEPAFVELSGIAGDRMGGLRPAHLRFDAVNGAPLPPDDRDGAAARTERLLFDLHEGIFAGWGLRWLYVVSGLLGCGVIATGLVLWTVKRRQKHIKGASAGARFGLRLVEVLNAGTIIGLPFGIALFFLANRLLPLQMEGRAQWEFHALFLGWGWALLWASVRPLKRAWIDLCRLAAAACLAIPLVNALTTERHLGASLPAGDWALAGFDLSMLGFAAGFALIAGKLRRKWAVPDEDGASAGTAALAARHGRVRHEPAE
ncbi:PepSY-associated TM helix domain-containing protein [Cereibacter johrii]|uniref:PepSY-associated TM helix domain-containing protein n=1 Tax=Cereibacter johrii TaxID=445629 RepID=UPI002B2622E1|nr:PepSY-associated TM helix domain-containing protein [Cereibacter johrii]MEA5162697.1 PepSY-associated TM helix domain-containing protein [Cereibacter johrii]